MGLDRRSRMKIHSTPIGRIDEYGWTGCAEGPDSASIDSRPCTAYRDGGMMTLLMIDESIKWRDNGA